MKKFYKVSLAAMTLLTLVACGPKRRPRTQPSTAQSEVTDGKNSKKESSGHEYYQTVLERYQAYSRAIEAGDGAGLEMYSCFLCSRSALCPVCMWQTRV